MEAAAELAAREAERVKLAKSRFAQAKAEAARLQADLAAKNAQALDAKSRSKSGPESREAEPAGKQ
jgi:hypothetical protein